MENIREYGSPDLSRLGKIKTSKNTEISTSNSTYMSKGSPSSYENSIFAASPIFNRRLSSTPRNISSFTTGSPLRRLPGRSLDMITKSTIKYSKYTSSPAVEDMIQKGYKFFSQKWILIKTKCIFDKDSYWNEVYDIYSKITGQTGTVSHDLWKFRNDLARFISFKICDLWLYYSPHLLNSRNVNSTLEKNLESKLTRFVGVCENFGSNDKYSDIDITIYNNNYNFNIFISNVINKFLSFLFGNDVLFKNEDDSYDYKLVNKFFDLNLYLTNFHLLKEKTLDEDLLSSYVLATNYEKFMKFDINYNNNIKYFNSLLTLKSKNFIISQFFYAFYNYISNGLNYFNYSKTFVNEYETKINFIEVIMKLINHDDIISSISFLSLLENESYHTQGAYFHVVMMHQRNIEFRDIENYSEIFINMMICSIIENLTFAYLNEYKKDKYIKRVDDALSKIINMNKNDIQQDFVNIYLKNINLSLQEQLDNLLNLFLVDDENYDENTLVNKNLLQKVGGSKIKKTNEKILYKGKKYCIYLKNYKTKVIKYKNEYILVSKL